MRLRGLLSGTAAAVLAAGLAVLSGQPAAYAETCPAPPGTELTSLPWAQRTIRPEQVAPFATGAGVTVATLDTGVQGDIPQFAGHVLTGADFLHGDGKGRGDQDCSGHGTGVASIIAAQSTYLHGLAPGVRILPVKVTEGDPAQDQGGEEQKRDPITPENFAKAITWAVDRQADVINMSIAWEEDHPAIRAAVKDAVERGVVLVASGGNKDKDGNSRISYPVGYDGVVGVGAVNEQGVVSPVSESGDWIDICAPGDSVTFAAPDGKYGSSTGTSLSAPFVSATAALVIESHPELRGKGAEVVKRILATASPAPGGMRSRLYGVGIVDPYRAVTDEMAPGAAPASMEPMTVAPRDPAAEARAEAERVMTSRAIWLATGVAVAVVLVLAGVGALRRGRRRGWRPSRRARDESGDADGTDGTVDGEPITLLHRLKL